MAIWSVDLTTQDGAQGATGLASYACFVAAALTAFGAWFVFGMLEGNTGALAMLIGEGIEFLLFVVAGIRFRIGKGAVWGIAAAALTAIELLYKLVLVSPLGVAINAIFLVLIVNGVRAAMALRRGFVDADAQAEIFS